MHLENHMLQRTSMFRIQHRMAATIIYPNYPHNFIYGDVRFCVIPRVKQVTNVTTTPVLPVEGIFHAKLRYRTRSFPNKHLFLARNCELQCYITVESNIILTSNTLILPLPSASHGICNIVGEHYTFEMIRQMSFEHCYTGLMYLHMDGQGNYQVGQRCFCVIRVESSTSIYIDTVGMGCPYNVLLHRFDADSCVDRGAVQRMVK